MSSWNDSIHFCQWQRVTCGCWHQRLTVSNLQSLELAGSISPYVGNLSFLRNLSLQNNKLQNKIPPEIGHLTRLLVLELYNNTKQGEIPSNLFGYYNAVTRDGPKISSWKGRGKGDKRKKNSNTHPYSINKLSTKTNTKKSLFLNILRYNNLSTKTKDTKLYCFYQQNPPTMNVFCPTTPFGLWKTKQGWQ